jgi:beta-galactosidase
MSASWAVACGNGDGATKPGSGGQAGGVGGGAGAPGGAGTAPVGGSGSGGLTGGAGSGTAGLGSSGAAGGGAGTVAQAGAAGSAGQATGAGGAAAAGGAAGQSGGGAGTAGAAGGFSGAGGSSGAADEPVNTYDGARATTSSFDFAWKFKLGDVTGAQAPDLDDASWTAVDVPHDWSISLPFNQSSKASFGGGYLDGGLGWYRKSFTLPASSSGQRLFLQFDGVYMDSTVWVNGTQVCARPYGYSSFECDFTASAKAGASNVVAVKVNNQLPSSRWYSGSGIYRHVWLKTVSPVHVAYTGTRVTTPAVTTASATVNVSVTVKNDSATDQSVTVANSFRDATGAEVGQATSAETAVAAGKSMDVTQAVTVSSPKLWSPASPSRYSVVTTVSAAGSVVDTYTTPFGIRSFAFDASTGFSLNGAALKINGVCLHHDLGSLGAAVNYRAIEKRLQLLKEMGANAIRTSHNPPAPELLDIADRLGFLVMDEAFDCWYNAKNTYDYGRFFREWATTDITDMVARDLNHPGVVIWSIANEVGETSDSTTVKQLMDAIKTRDTTRPIGQALAAWASADTAAVGLEDVVGINYAPDRYDSIHAAHPTWKMFASESSSALRSRGVYNNDNNQCSSYDDFAAGWGHTAETSWKNVNTRPWIAGEFIWTGFDYIGEPTPYEWPSKSSYFGAIDTANFPKDVFYFYQSKWNASGPPMVHVVPMNWTNYTAGQAVKVMVYTNADSVELFLNDKSLGSKTLSASTGHLDWSVPFATGTLEARRARAGAWSRATSSRRRARQRRSCSRRIEPRSQRTGAISPSSR